MGVRPSRASRAIGLLGGKLGGRYLCDQEIDRKDALGREDEVVRLGIEDDEALVVIDPPIEGCKELLETTLLKGGVPESVKSDGWLEID